MLLIYPNIYKSICLVSIQQSLVEQCPGDDPDTEINLGCLLFKVLLKPQSLSHLLKNKYKVT